MALFGKISAAGSGNGAASSAASDAFNGVLVINTGTVTMSSSTQQIALQPIANYYGLPASRMNVSITVADLNGNTTTASVNGVSTAIYEFQLYGKSGNLLYDGKGQDNDFINDAHMLNPYGYYAGEVSPVLTTTATTYTNVFSTVLGLSIDPSEFPLTPIVTVNTIGSRATTLNGLTSTAQLQVWMDFERHSFVRAKLRSYIISGVTTGIFPIQAQLDKNVNVLSHAYYFASDSNMSGTQSINFANNGVQLINQTTQASFIQRENSLYPSNKHITGFFPLNVAYARPWNSNYSTVLQFNVATAPTIGGVASVIKAKLLEAY